VLRPAIFRKVTFYLMLKYPVLEFSIYLYFPKYITTAFIKACHDDITFSFIVHFTTIAAYFQLFLKYYNI